MGGAELILGPVVLLTGVLAGVVLGVDTVNVLEPVTVTASMEQRGLSSEVVTHRLITRLAQIADLESEFHEIGGKDMAGEGFTESLAEAVGMGEIVLAARRLPGSVEAEFRPEFVERGDGTILRLRILRPQTGVHLVHEFKVEGYPIEPTLREASRAIFVMVDPVALAMDDLWRGDLVAARQSVERALHMSGGRERQVAEMLRGIQQLAEDDAAAAERTLRAALLHRQDFAPARLALAMTLARTRGASAARAELDVLERHAAEATWSQLAAKEVAVAVAYVRARLAAAEGNWAEAVRELRWATEAEPNFAAAHEALAGAYLALRQAPFAEYHADMALRLTAPDIPRLDDHLDHLLQLAVTPIRPRIG